MISNQYWKLGLASALVIGGAIAFGEDCAWSQITSDRTLGKESSQVTSKSPNNFQIDGGATRGKNLFHSFSEFSVSTNGTAYFNNTLDIQNIISRVTGGSVSKIDGLLQANGTANLFLLNPQGIMFGPNASLHIGGSFVASTASSLNFADGTKFSATNPQTAPLLTMSVPIGLQFGATPGNILNQSQASPDRALNSIGKPVGLKVQPGRTLALVGGDVTLSGGNLTAAGGRIEIGSVAGNSLVSLNPTDQGWALSYGDVWNFQNIQLSQRIVDRSETPSYIDTSGEVSGNIQLQGRRVMLNGGSEIIAQNQGSQTGGNLKITASESVELIDPGTALTTQTLADGKAGDLTITTARLRIQGGAAVSTGSSGVYLSSNQFKPATGQGGNLTVNASESVELTGTSVNGFIVSSLLASTQGSGDAGKLKITTDQLIVREGAAIDVSSAVPVNEIYLGDVGSRGKAGELEITARSIQLDNRARLSVETASREGGNITLQVHDLQLRHNSKISTNAGSRGNGGNITIKTDTLIGLENSNTSANTVGGEGGKVRITTLGLFLSPDTKITASSGQGAQGDIVVKINALDTDPSRGLVKLPKEVLNIARLLVQRCPDGEGNVAQGSRFIVTGRGGLPPTPRETLSNDNIIEDWGKLALVSAQPPIASQSDAKENQSGSSTVFSNHSTHSVPVPIVEAQGWIIDTNGKLVLTVNAPTVTLYSSRLTPANCPGT